MLAARRKAGGTGGGEISEGTKEFWHLTRAAQKQAGRRKKQPCMVNEASRRRGVSSPSGVTDTCRRSSATAVTWVDPEPTASSIQTLWTLIGSVDLAFLSGFRLDTCHNAG